jgi:hypothetical protein
VNNDGGYECTCDMAGYEYDEVAMDCADVDECAWGGDNAVCDVNATCTNTDGSWDCACNAGFDTAEDGACTDIDECAATDPAACGGTATCSNTDGAYSCDCMEGYWYDAAGMDCADVDECAAAVSPCEEGLTCSNNDGAYECLAVPVGENCSAAAGLDENGHASLTGDFAVDVGYSGSCVSAPWSGPEGPNSVWFSFDATASGQHVASAVMLGATGTWSDPWNRLVIYDGCGPEAAEVACGTATGPDVDLTFDAEAGKTYKVLYHTDGDSYAMVDPSITVGPSACQAYCDLAAANCTGENTIDFVDLTCLEACAMWDAGVEGATDGDTLACRTYHVGGPAAGDPATHCPHAGPDGGGVCVFVAPAGYECSSAADVTGVEWPYVLTGNFDLAAGFSGSCVSPPWSGPEGTNAVWFSYTAGADGDHVINVNNAGTQNAYSRMAVYESAGAPSCESGMTEVSCDTASSQSLTGTVPMVTGMNYLILFHTDGSSYEMLDPDIAITAP